MNHKFEEHLGSILSVPILKANFYFPLIYCAFQIYQGKCLKELLSTLNVWGSGFFSSLHFPPVTTQNELEGKSSRFWRCRWGRSSFISVHHKALTNVQGGHYYLKQSRSTKGRRQSICSEKTFAVPCGHSMEANRDGGRSCWSVALAKHKGLFHVFQS